MKSKDPLIINKILSAFLIGGLVLMSSKYVVNMLYHPTVPTTALYKIEVPEVAITGKETVLQPIAVRLNTLAQDQESAMKLGTRLFKKCVSCHTINKGDKNKIGPNLWDVVGNKAGDVDGFAYSSNLPKVGEWSFENLDAYLTKPSALVKGTKMSFAGIKNPEQRASVILYLQTFSDSPIPVPSPE